MAWVDPAAKITGDIITAAEWNQTSVDNTQYLYDNGPQSAQLFFDNFLVTVGGGSMSHSQNSGAAYATRYEISTKALNDAAEKDFLLADGTYTFGVLGGTANSLGLLTWYVDGVSIVASQDWYSGAGVENVLKTHAAITITGTGRHVLKMVISGKNASSSGYGLRLATCWFRPAAFTTGV